MKLPAENEEYAHLIAEWLSDNISPGYAYVPAGTATKLVGKQYKAYDDKWIVSHYFLSPGNYVDVSGLDSEEELMLRLRFN